MSDLPVAYKGNVTALEKKFFNDVSNQIWASENNIGFFKNFKHSKDVQNQASRQSLELRELRHSYQLEVRKQEQSYTLELVGQHRRYYLAKMKAFEQFGLGRLQADLQSQLTIFIRTKIMSTVQELQEFATETGTSIMKTTDYAHQVLDELTTSSNQDRASRRKSFLENLEANALESVEVMANPQNQVSVLEQFLLPE